MEKKEIDQLYHLLRRLSNIEDEKDSRGKATLTNQEQIHTYYGLCRHLLAGGDYQALVQYSQMYGEMFLIEPAYKAIRRANWKPTRIVELGAGLGWLSRGLSAKFGLMPYLLVDKRPWPLTSIVADIETQKGVSEVLRNLKGGDIIVVCDVLHCLDDPYEVMANFSGWPTLVLEYMPEDDNFRESYSTQIMRYGANPLLRIDDFDRIFPCRAHTISDANPYVMLLIEPGK